MTMPHPFAPHDRRHRRPDAMSAGLFEIPAYERSDATLHAAGEDARMGQVLRMDATGLWVVRLGGRLAELNGRTHWDSREALQADAERTGLTLSDLIVRTGGKV